ncbi:Polysaccharide deacetylase [Caprobacter fermentans]|uniref:Polysaccharide deacetylase n=2 Tax=Caproicibacter fermentans TaxID=2576756 RepID=A0A6N8HWQ3_9FIRM|nr:polysaccharide deacetylase family protein [Caproicibacter fermentans]MVB10261.1 Polysaccharide deacetylase [Caproicibacter fermentans]
MFLSVKIHRYFLFIAIAVLLVSGFCGGAVAAVQQAGADRGIPLPIIMYHSILRESRRQGNYTVSPDTLESDLAWLKKNGYQTVVVQDLLDYVKRQVPLPEKPVMITFDDGFYNNYYYAYPIAKKYQAKIIISPVGYYTDLYTGGDADHANYSYLTWGEIDEMMRSGLVEFQNHSYNLHSTQKRYGALKLKKESASDYQSVLKQDLEKMQREMKENTGYTPAAFVYPFGAVSKESIPVLHEIGFQASMNCMKKMNYITRDPDCLFGLGRYIRPTGISSDSFFRKIGLK